MRKITNEKIGEIIARSLVTFPLELVEEKIEDVPFWESLVKSEEGVLPENSERIPVLAKKSILIKNERSHYRLLTDKEINDMNPEQSDIINYYIVKGFAEVKKKADEKYLREGYIVSRIAYNEFIEVLKYLSETMTIKQLKKSIGTFMEESEKIIVVDLYKIDDLDGFKKGFNNLGLFPNLSGIAKDKLFISYSMWWDFAIKIIEKLPEDLLYYKRLVAELKDCWKNFINIDVSLLNEIKDGPEDSLSKPSDIQLLEAIKKAMKEGGIIEGVDEIKVIPLEVFAKGCFSVIENDEKSDNLSQVISNEKKGENMEKELIDEENKVSSPTGIRIEVDVEKLKSFGDKVNPVFLENPDLLLPTRETPGSAGYDLVYPFRTPLTLWDREQVVIESFIKVHMPLGVKCDMHLRSSMGVERKLRLSNQTGIIDSDYTMDTIKIPLSNISGGAVEILPMERVVQIIFGPHYLADNDRVKKTARTGGIGSTGRLKK